MSGGASGVGAGLTATQFAAHWPGLELVALHGVELGPVRDQGQRGTCLAFATSAAHEAVRGEPDALCVEWLFCAAKQRDGDADDGTTTPAIREALVSVGQPEEHVWPYDEARSHKDAAYALPALNGSACYKHATTGRPRAVADVVAALDAGTTPVLVVTVTRPFHYARRGNSLIGALAAAAPVLGSHAVLAVGYGRDPRDGQLHVVIRNSWGDGWGEGGYALVAPEYLRFHLKSVFTLP